MEGITELNFRVNVYFSVGCCQLDCTVLAVRLFIAGESRIMAGVLGTCNVTELIQARRPTSSRSSRIATQCCNPIIDVAGSVTALWQLSVCECNESISYFSK